MLIIIDLIKEMVERVCAHIYRAVLKLILSLNNKDRNFPGKPEGPVSFNTLQKSKDELLTMPKFLAKYIEKKMI